MTDSDRLDDYLQDDAGVILLMKTIVTIVIIAAHDKFASVDDLENFEAVRERAQLRCYVWDWPMPDNHHFISPCDLSKGGMAEVIEEVNADKGLEFYSIIYSYDQDEPTRARFRVKYKTPRRWKWMANDFVTKYKICAEPLRPIDRFLDYESLLRGSYAR
ncbi:hypothetical protein FOZ63_033390 [Perkinsus olseni]|uniref:Uncharacterized protein n=1 Tax=Perkinsus olseni TaxID=32597 RepID=A0A7J6Q1H0_PEROL|nr:hypothetical protein FOZ63_033390 [Perkinsus olseni]